MSPVPQLDRIAHRLESFDERPLVHLWGWPGSGLRALLEKLAAARPDTSVLLAADEDPLAARRDSLLPQLFWWTPRLAGGLLDSLASVATPGRRLVVASFFRPLTHHPPETSMARILPSELTLEHEEARHWLPDRDNGELETLWRRTAGWAGPMRWLVEEGEGWRQRFEEWVLACLDPRERQVITDLAEVAGQSPGGRFGAADLEIWRLAHHDRPQDLSALERLIHGWGLLSSEGSLPPIWAEWCRDLSSAEGLALRPASDMTLARALVKEIRIEPIEAPEAPAPHPRFELELLGEPRVVRVVDGHREVLRWRLHRAFLFLAFLVTRPGRRARKDQLIEALWPETGEAAIQRNFHPTVSLARQTLSGGAFETLISSQGTYFLSETVDWSSDVETFETAIERGETLRHGGRPREAIETWSVAWRLYRGPLLAGVDSSWVVELRGRLRQRYLGLLRNLGDLAAELGEITLAIDAHRSLLLDDPFEEPSHRSLMELYGRRGRRDLVRRQYVRLQELLRDDLGIEPSAETQRRYHELMR